MLKFEPLEEKSCSIPQMKAFWPKIKIGCDELVENSHRREKSIFCTYFCHHKLSPGLILLRAETGSLLVQIGGHMGSIYEREVGSVASTKIPKMIENRFYHEKQRESL